MRTHLVVATIFTIISIVVALALPQAVAKPSQKSPPEPSEIVETFLSACAGSVLDNRVGRIIAYSNCIGRLDGFATGHETTFQLFELATQSYEKTNKAKVPRVIGPLWCLPSSINGVRLFEDVVGWAESNKEDFAEIMKKYPGSNGSMATTIKALHRAYPCK